MSRIINKILTSGISVSFMLAGSGTNKVIPLPDPGKRSRSNRKSKVNNQSVNAPCLALRELYAVGPDERLLGSRFPSAPPGQTSGCWGNSVALEWDLNKQFKLKQC